jgi:ring-1,2-phenylacetyl-CoA epoxidase subunit PaaC
VPSLPPIRPEDEAVAARSRPTGAFDSAHDEAHGRTLFELLLRLGDDSLILSQRLGEWTGHAPSVEVDLSLANIALDLVGQATHFLTLAAEVEGKGRDADALAFRRDVLDFRNCWLVEQPNGDFAQTMARQLLFSTWQRRLFDQLKASADDRIAAVAAKAVKEVAYHEELAAEWVIRLGDGTKESRRRMIDGLEWMGRFVPELFEVDEVAAAATARGLAPDLGGLRAGYDARVQAVLSEAGLPALPQQRPVLGGRRGHHSEHLGHLLAVMQYLPRTYPDAVW